MGSKPHFCEMRGATIMDKINNEKAAGGVETITVADADKQGNSNPRQTTQKALQDESSRSQRLRLLERLKVAPVDTITARRELDVMHPAARIQELKQRGNLIDTVRVGRPSDCGKVHRVALYVLLPGEGCDD
jgi:hypothetical protein